ncbi:hypothetical protein E4U54_003303 [Claviceps lovelessii]|nr:hypothetical protein E4U54_003303 [Claviceps lovelessii]
MARSSSDGRGREQPSKHISHDKNNLARGLKNPDMEQLKPASPPKTNPWTTRRPTTTLSSDWPSINPDFDRINGQGNGNDETTVKDKPVRKQKQQCSRPSGGKGSDTFSPSEPKLQGPTPPPGKSLWLRPFGADIFVRAGSQIFEGHDPIDIQLELHPYAVANTLQFMYTKTLESCEYDRKVPRDWIHVPRSVLLYIAATGLGVEALKAQILQILRQTANDLVLYFQEGVLAQAMTEREVIDGVFHLHNALEAAYSSEHHLPDMLPLRLALGVLLDTLLPFLIQHPVMVALLSSAVWKKYAAEISSDVLAARNSEKCARGPSHDDP